MPKHFRLMNYAYSQGNFQGSKFSSLNSKLPLGSRVLEITPLEKDVKRWIKFDGNKERYEKEAKEK